MVGGQHFPLNMKVMRVEKIKVPSGTFECYVIEPEYRKESTLKPPKGAIKLWVTRDALKIPIKVTTDLPFGEIKMELIKARGLNSSRKRL